MEYHTATTAKETTKVEWNMYREGKLNTKKQCHASYPLQRCSKINRALHLSYNGKSKPSYKLRKNHLQPMKCLPAK